MKEERKRIFISELPETATEDAIKAAFNQYGRVQNVEIKERKELGPKNSSLFFSYVNIDIGQRELQQCFKDFANGKWLGQYVMLQVARESFLDRIKREREENNPDQSREDDRRTSIHVETIEAVDELKENNNEPTKVTHESPVKEKNSVSIAEDKLDDIDYIIKDNKRKSHRGTLKIESIGKEPIFIQDLKPKTNLNAFNPANQKRLESLRHFKQSYQQQKTVIKAALSKVDQPNNKKNFFGNDNEHSFSPTKRQKLSDSRTNKSLFDDQSEDEEDNFEANFAVKEQFLGEKGQKLLELQSRYKNDKRFQLDSRFVEDEENQNEPEEITEDSLEEEKRKQLEILEGILGTKIAPKTKRTTESTKRMLRFDPSQPEHSKFEIPKEPKKKTRKEQSIDNEKKLEETDTPVVSKEVFYKVNENIKNSLHTSGGFSLLDTFGVAQEKEKENEERVVEATPSKSFPDLNETNPFAYDSSEEEDETGNVTNQGFNKTQGPKFMWTESLFFGEDDYRLQEGFDFIEKMKCDDNDFVKLRRELKFIIRTKVRNNLAKKKPFKRKLGGSKMKKVMRIKKALKK